MDEIDPRVVARRRAYAEELVRHQVTAQTFADLPAPSLRQKLAAGHCALSASVSPLALGAAYRAGLAAAMREARHHRPRFGQG